MSEDQPRADSSGPPINEPVESETHDLTSPADEDSTEPVEQVGGLAEPVDTPTVAVDLSDPVDLSEPVEPSVAEASQAPARGRHQRPSMTVGDKVRFGLRGIGQTLITCGLVVLLFVVYEVYVTNWFAHREQQRVHTALEQQFANGQDPLSLPAGQLAKLDGQGLANLYIPRFGLDYAWTIVQGTNDADLEKGPGHYVDTQLPGEMGNFAVAGHRVGKGEPFLNLDKVQAGDAVIVETQSTWFVYCVIGAGGQDPTSCDPNAAGASLTNVDKNDVPGRAIVEPSAGQVVLPVPSKANAPRPYTRAYLTLTTCTPKFTASQRMIVHAVLDSTYPQGIAKTKVDNKYSTAVPAEISAFYTQVGN